MGPVLNCLFCRCASFDAVSEEHVLPVALGNSTLVVPAGVVCDACNNYFAVKVEKPLVEVGRFRDLRARQGLRSRRGRTLARRAVLSGTDWPASFLVVGDRVVFWADHADSAERFWDRVDSDPEAALLPVNSDYIDNARLSRLLAKGALEHLALRTHKVAGWERYAWSHEFDRLRQWARAGLGGPWPVNERRLYDEDTPFIQPDGTLRQTIWEAELWAVTPHCHYWVVCIFGVEYAINYREREVASYRNWLSTHGGLSPLYAHRQSPSQGISVGFNGCRPV